MRNKFNQSPDDLYTQALNLHHNGKFSKAESLYLKLLKIIPNHPSLLASLATVLMQQNKSDLGIFYAKKSLALNPHQFDLIFNLAIEYNKVGNFDLALELYQKCESNFPNSPDLYLNMGNTLRDLRRFDDAISLYDKAIFLRNDFYQAQWNKALSNLTIGNFIEGWKLYESGWTVGERKPYKNYKSPIWNGLDTINGKKLYVHAEQGLGDSIQFCRYIVELEKMGAEIFFEIPASLVNLFKTLKIQNTRLFREGEKIPDYDFAIPLISLPYLLKTDLSNIPNNTPYLSSTNEAKTYWEEKLGSKNKPRIGIVWSGSRTNTIDNNISSRRHIPLALWEPILELPYEFHGLQKEIYPSDQIFLKKYKNLVSHHKELSDFASTAGLIMEMDLVISVCTSVAHLSGALNHSTWVIIPYSSDFRWLLDIDHSPWYPSIKLFRKEEPHDWKTIIQKVAIQLKNNL